MREKRGFLSEVQLVLPIVMERLAQEDIQAIISGVATNPQLVSGIVAQLREAIQPPTPTVPTPGTGTVPPTVETRQPEQQASQQNPPLPPTQGLRHYISNDVGRLVSRARPFFLNARPRRAKKGSGEPPLPFSFYCPQILGTLLINIKDR